MHDSFYDEHVPRCEKATYTIHDFHFFLIFSISFSHHVYLFSLGFSAFPAFYETLYLCYVVSLVFFSLILTFHLCFLILWVSLFSPLSHLPYVCAMNFARNGFTVIHTFNISSIVLLNLSLTRFIYT